MTENLLLRAMPSLVRDACLDHGEAFRVTVGNSVPNGKLDGRDVFIVTSGVVSLLQRSSSGRISEIGMIGNEGMFPMCALMNVPAKRGIIVAQIGELNGLRLRTADFHALLAPFAEATGLVRKYAYSLVIQIASNMMSAVQDGVEQRVARWMLMSHDRAESDDILVTHEMLAQMAYAHRPTVSNILRSFKERAIIATGRGCVTLLDRPQLVRIADGSYGQAEGYWREYIAPFGKDDVEGANPSVPDWQIRATG